MDGDRANYLDYENSDYDLYSYEDPIEGRTTVDENLPSPSSLRQVRPYRKLRRRPYSGRYSLNMRDRLPPRRNPEIHKIPGRIQTVPGGRRFSAGEDRIEDSVYSETFNSKPAINRAPDCDLYTNDLCLNVKNYPIQEITSLLGANRRISDDMVADVNEQSADDLIDGVSSNQENTYTFSHYFGENRREDTSQHRDFAQEGGFLCPSEIKYAKPKRGKTAQGEWKDIVNVNDYTQTLRMEKCLQPGGTCSYVSHHYKSQCSQVYNYHRLLSWNKERGLHMDIYKVPTCCSCHIMGYSYVYPPLNKDGVKSPAASQSRPPPKQSISSSLSNHIPDFNSQQPSSFASQSRPPPKLSISSSLNNLLPDFNPQQELEQFMQTIGGDLKDFNTFGKSQRPVRQQPNSVLRPGISRPTSSLDTSLRVPPFRAVSSRRKGNYPRNPEVLGSNPERIKQGTRGTSFLGSETNEYPVRRGDGFSPSGEPTLTEESDGDPGHKYESIPLQSDVVNYGYHPIIDFFDN